MTAATTKNLPYPTAGDRPHIDQSLAALAAKIDLILPTLTDTQIAALAGADLWDGKIAFQSNAGAVRKWRGLYGYLSSIPGWRSLIPVGPMASWTPVITAASGGLSTGAGLAVGDYSEVGGLVVASFHVHFSSSCNAGTGVWSVTLPVNHTLTQNAPIGRFLWQRATAPFSSALAEGEIETASASSLQMWPTGTTGALGSTNVPFSTISGGDLFGAMIYRKV